MGGGDAWLKGVRRRDLPAPTQAALSMPCAVVSSQTANSGGEAPPPPDGSVSVASPVAVRALGTHPSATPASDARPGRGPALLSSSSPAPQQQQQGQQQQHHRGGTRASYLPSSPSGGSDAQSMTESPMLAQQQQHQQQRERGGVRPASEATLAALEARRVTAALAQQQQRQQQGATASASPPHVRGVAGYSASPKAMSWRRIPVATP